MRKITKKGDFNFVWMFAIIAGSAILLLAIYGAVRFGTTTSKFQGTEVAKTLAVVTDPLQAGFAAARRSVIRFPKDTLIVSECEEDSSFGRNVLSVMIKERPNEDFEIFGDFIPVNDKYIFVSENPGKEFYVFSVPISFSFRVADVLIMDSAEYCFLGLDVPEIRRILSTGLANKAKFGSANCTSDSITVCFGTGGCDINVVDRCDNFDCDYDFEVGRIEKPGFSREYAGNLFYPTLFADSRNYDCNIRRILYRQSILSEIYINKIDRMNSRNCNSNIGPEVRLLGQRSLAFSINLNAGDIHDLYFLGREINNLEARGQCRVWS